MRKKEREKMNCEICFEFYNKEARRPMTILPCTHTFCNQCLNELKKIKYKCPKCKKNITNEIPCYALLNILDNIGFNCDANLELKQKIFEQLNEIRDAQEQLRSHCEYKLESISSEINLIKTEINKRASKLISLIKINREKLLYEADCIQSNLSDLVLENLLVIQDIKLDSHNVNLMKRNQLKGLKDELIRYKTELIYKLSQLNEMHFNYEFEPNREINYKNSFIGEIGFKSTIVTGSNKICSIFDCPTNSINSDGYRVKIWKVNTGECINTFENQMPIINSNVKECETEFKQPTEHSISRSFSCDKIKKSRKNKKNSITSLQFVTNV